MRIDYPDKSQLPQLKALWKAAFGDGDEFVEAFFAHGYSPDRSRVVTTPGDVAAMLFWFDGSCRGQKCAYLYGVATHLGFRGRGLCRQLMEDTHKLLARRGYAAALLYPAGEDLRLMYGKMGYENCGREEQFSCTAGAPISLREVTKEEYAALRRTYLRPDGVIQEGENLEFLAATAKLYAGEDFLAATVTDGKTLTVPELLGSREAAPGIVAALGCEKGAFRRGAEAMIHPLIPDAPVPGYLGLVFD